MLSLSLSKRCAGKCLSYEVAGSTTHAEHTLNFMACTVTIVLHFILVFFVLFIQVYVHLFISWSLYLLDIIIYRFFFLPIFRKPGDNGIQHTKCEFTVIFYL